MLHLDQILDLEELSLMMKDKRITKQTHPTLPLGIYNYTARAQYQNEWTKAERVCRGLIVEEGTNKVIARGPEKFFNYGQTGAPETSLDSLVRVTTKHDGSLGIGWAYDRDGETHFGVATRGSFTSEQAIKAEKLANNLAFPDFWEDVLNTSREGNTMVFEIIYPENRIVVSYGREESLRFLGDVDNLSGIIVARPFDIEVGSVITLKEALELEIPADEEGYVLDIIDQFPGGYRKSVGHVKLKGETYKILHGLLTNTNARRIWVQLAARACHHLVTKDKQWAGFLGHDPEDFKRVNVEESLEETLLSNVPDEFYGWVTEQINSINSSVVDFIDQAVVLADKVKGVESPRERYEMVKDHPMTTDILHLASGGSSDKIMLKAWKLSKPSGDETPFKTQED